MHLMIVVEGDTEEVFVKEVLAPHLLNHGVDARATIVGKVLAERRRGVQRGGGRFQLWRRDIERLLKEDRKGKRRVTTLFDLYGLPDDFPGLDVHGADADTNRRCDALQAALAEVFDNDWRLIPYIQRHEFEALVLGALPALREQLDAEDDLAGLGRLEQEIAGQALEDINDGKDTAPSKRLKRIPGYGKVQHGPQAVKDTGLAALRARCPRFDAWVTRLESLA